MLRLLVRAGAPRHASTPPAHAHGVRGRRGRIRAPSGRKALALFGRGRLCGPLGAKSYSWTPLSAPNTHCCPRASLLKPRRTPSALVSDQPRTRRAAPTPRRAALWSADLAAGSPRVRDHGLRRELLLLFNNFQPERQIAPDRVRLDRRWGRQNQYRHQGQERRGVDHGQEDPE